jgi:predicted nucleotidyltransferase
MVNKAIKKEGPRGIQVVPFGSHATGLDSANSDLDLCIIDPERPSGELAASLAI